MELETLLMQRFSSAQRRYDPALRAVSDARGMRRHNAWRCVHCRRCDGWKTAEQCRPPQWDELSNVRPAQAGEEGFVVRVCDPDGNEYESAVTWVFVCSRRCEAAREARISMEYRQWRRNREEQARELQRARRALREVRRLLSDPDHLQSRRREYARLGMLRI